MSAMEIVGRGRHKEIVSVMEVSPQKTFDLAKKFSGAGLQGRDPGTSSLHSPWGTSDIVCVNLMVPTTSMSFPGVPSPSRISKCDPRQVFCFFVFSKLYAIDC